ncbi:MAG: hypothetical protein ACRDF4_12115 [Rhabdochlamydiaceae bacterium]
MLGRCNRLSRGSKAVSLGVSALIVIMVIVAAFVGYTFSSVSQRAIVPQTTTLINTVTQSKIQNVTFINYVTNSVTQTTTYTLKSTQTTTVTSTVIQPIPSTTDTTSCAISGPTMGVVIRILDGGLVDTAYPIVGAIVSGNATGYCNNALQTQVLQPALTNSSGWATLLDGGFGIYNLRVSYIVDNNLTETYYLSISMQPTTVSYVIFNVTTGNVTTHNCEYNLHCQTGAT